MRARVLLIAEFDIDGDDPSDEIAEVVDEMRVCLDVLVGDNVVPNSILLTRISARELSLGLAESQSGWETF